MFSEFYGLNLTIDEFQVTSARGTSLAGWHRRKAGVRQHPVSHGSLHPNERL